jgi:hypothetical protein
LGRTCLVEGLSTQLVIHVAGNAIWGHTPPQDHRPDCRPHRGRQEAGQAVSAWMAHSARHL